MALITRDEVRKIAKISAIEIEESELDALAEELDAVLNYASYLKTVANEYKSESQLLFTTNRFRPDQTTTFESKQLVEMAPAHEENYFVVPVIVKQ